MGRFATFLVGGLVGAGIALLTTPRTGEENRALINDTLNENYPDAMKAARATTNQLVDAAATTSTKVINTVVDKGAEVKKRLLQSLRRTTNCATRSMQHASASLLRLRRMLKRFTTRQSMQCP